MSAVSGFPGSAWISRLRGQRRRQRGRYDSRTEALFQRACAISPGPVNRLALARFRRDLGRLPGEGEAVTLLHHIHHFKGDRLRQAVNLLIECGLAESVLDAVPDRRLQQLASASPAIAAALAADTVLSDPTRRLAELHRAQRMRRAALREIVRARRGAICVVGNAGSLSGAGHGAAIDSNDFVIRFNRFTSSEVDAGDTGEKIDLWVRAPDLVDAGRTIRPSAPWILLSGPDPCFQLGSWEALIELEAGGAHVVTLPLASWRTLVARLEAPPSAGLLVLAWIIEQLGSPRGVTAAGFQLEEDNGSAYHHALPSHRGSERHRWAAERQLLQEWRQQGLAILANPSAE